jgi:hypothetical protein
MDYEHCVEYSTNFLIFFTRRVIYLTSGTHKLFIGKEIGMYLKITYIFLTERTNKMRPGSRIYYSSVF